MIFKTLYPSNRMMDVLQTRNIFGRGHPSPSMEFKRRAAIHWLRTHSATGWLVDRADRNYPSATSEAPQVILHNPYMHSETQPMPAQHQQGTNVRSSHELENAGAVEAPALGMPAQ